MGYIFNTFASFTYKNRRGLCLIRRWGGSGAGVLEVSRYSSIRIKVVNWPINICLNLGRDFVAFVRFNFI